MKVGVGGGIDAHTETTLLFVDPILFAGIQLGVSDSPAKLGSLSHETGGRLRLRKGK